MDVPKNSLARIRIKSKIRLPRISDVEMILLLKPIVDIFWQYRLLDYFLCVILAFAILRRANAIIPLRLTSTDIFLAVLVLLYFFTFTRTIQTNELSIYVKMFTALMMFIAGKIADGEVKDYIRFSFYGHLFALIINLVAIILGFGQTLWGDANTFTGLYYFKTDFAAMLCVLSIFLMTQNNFNVVYVFLEMICIGLSVLTNTRIALLVLLIIIVAGIMYQKEIRKQRVKLKLNFKTAIILLLSFIIIVLVFQYLSQTELFREMGFITLNVKKVTDLLSMENTSGRTLIWQNLMDNFREHGLIQRLFGVSVNNNLYLPDIEEYFDAHSLYFATIYGVGYIGLVVFICFVVSLLKRMRKAKNRKLFYICFMLLITYLVFGISLCTNEFTNFTWISFFFFGLMENKRANNYVII